MNKSFIGSIPAVMLVLIAASSILIPSPANAEWVTNMDQKTIRGVCQTVGDNVMFVDIGVGSPSSSCNTQGPAWACPGMWAHINPNTPGAAAAKEQILAAYLSKRPVTLRIYTDNPSPGYTNYCTIGVVVNN